MYDSTKRYLYTLKPGQEFRVSGIDYILLTIDDGEHDGSVVAITKEPMFSVDSYGRIVSLEERFNMTMREATMSLLANPKVEMVSTLTHKLLNSHTAILKPYIKHDTLVGLPRKIGMGARWQKSWQGYCSAINKNEFTDVQPAPTGDYSYIDSQGNNHIGIIASDKNNGQPKQLYVHGICYMSWLTEIPRN